MKTKTFVVLAGMGLAAYWWHRRATATIDTAAQLTTAETIAQYDAAAAAGSAP